MKRSLVINLASRPERLRALCESPGFADWPDSIPRPQQFKAVDGRRVAMPPGWRNGPGAWGCYLSHMRILEDALQDGVSELYVFEDDAWFPSNWAKRASQFLEAVPSNWDSVYFGGQHMNLDRGSTPQSLGNGVLKAVEIQRTHAFALRGSFIERAYLALHDKKQHVDWTLSALHKSALVYAPERFMVAQNENYSDIDGRHHPRRFWNPPQPHEKVAVFVGDAHHIERLLGDHGDLRFHLGYQRAPGERFVDAGLQKIVHQALSGSSGISRGEADVHRALHALISMLREEAASIECVAALYHPRVATLSDLELSRFLPPGFEYEFVEVSEAGVASSGRLHLNLQSLYEAVGLTQET